jgi:Uma2 family endonuclease
MDTTFRSDERFTQAEFLAWLAKHSRMLTGTCELIGGAIVMAPPANYPHSILITRLIYSLQTHVRSGSLGQVHAPSAGYEFRSGDTLEPDVSFVSSARLLAGPKPRSGQMMRVVPDLVIEVLSRSNERYDRKDKKKIYALNGVDEYWLVAPRNRSVTVLRRTGEAYDQGVSYVNGDIRSHVLPALTLTVDELFADLAT